MEYGNENKLKLQDEMVMVKVKVWLCDFGDLEEMKTCSRLKVG